MGFERTLLFSSSSEKQSFHNAAKMANKAAVSLEAVYGSNTTSANQEKIEDEEDNKSEVAYL